MVTLRSPHAHATKDSRTVPGGTTYGGGTVRSIRELSTGIGEVVSRAIVRVSEASSDAPASQAMVSRHRELEERLAAANAEIEHLRARLREATRKPTSFTEARAEELANMRQRRLWIARGGDRQP